MSNQTDCLPEASCSPDGVMRLNKFLRAAGIDSRRHCDELIAAGRVTVNGQVCDQLGTKVDPELDKVLVDGVAVSLPLGHVTLMLNKPVGYLSTMSDPAGKPCVADLVPIEEHPALFHIGRLDSDTSGLLLFSTDGALGHGLLHPAKEVWKTYLARVEGFVLDEQVKRLEQGVRFDGFLSAPARVKLLEPGKRSSVLEITIHEGRNRQVRRMCQAIGHNVIELKRIEFAGLRLDGLPDGSWRLLSDSETSSLYEFARP